MTTTNSPVRVTVQFILLALAWGSSFLFIAEALRGVSPIQVVLSRVVIGAVVLGIMSLVSRAAFPRSVRIWLHLTVVAMLLCVVPFSLYAWAGQFIDSGLASIINATTPLMTALVALIALREERPTAARIAGLCLGFIGVIVVLGPGLGGSSTNAWAAQLACLGATASYGCAFVYLRKFVTPLRLQATAVATMQVGIAAVIMLIAAPFTAMTPVTLDWRVIASLALLGGVGTGLAYVWNVNIVDAWGATTASAVTYLSPVVGVTLGTLVRHEQLTWNEPVGGVIIVLGILLLRRQVQPRARVQAPVR